MFGPRQIEAVKRRVARVPVVGRLASGVYRKLLSRQRKLAFTSSPQYWEDRYALGGTSGRGSYGRLAAFKAATLNGFVRENGVRSVVEFGCGDGAQLALAAYPSYTGVDVSTHAVALCAARFAKDGTKRFLHTADPKAATLRADLALSLDVIYHLVEDAVFHAYMKALVAAADRFIGIYSDDAEQPMTEPHVRHRCFTQWMAANAPDWTLIRTVPNPYPLDANDPDETSWADFYFFGRRGEEFKQP